MQAGTPSDPLLLAGGSGYTHRMVHLAHEADASVTFTLMAGTGLEWKPVAEVQVPAKGSGSYVLPADVEGDWVRVVADRDAPAVTAVFRYGIRGGTATDSDLFAAIPDVGSTEPWIAATLRSGDDDSLPLDVFARDVDGEGSPAVVLQRFCPCAATASGSPTSVRGAGCSSSVACDRPRCHTAKQHQAHG